MNVGHVDDADERRIVLLIKPRPLDALPAQRIGPVEHHELLVQLRARFHRDLHRADVRV